MVKVTFSTSVGNNPNISNVSCRVLTENLLNNDKIDVHFTNAPITLSYRALSKSNVRELYKIDGRLKIVEGYYTRFVKSILTKTWGKEYMNTVKGDYLLYSMNTGIHDYGILSHALNDGASVVAGGTEIIKHEFQYVRDKFIACGVEEKNLKNLMLLDGYVTPNTNLIPYINDWKDTVIPNEGLSGIQYAKRDYMQFDQAKQIKRIVDRIDPLAFKLWIWPECISVMLDNRCYWNKCRFCNYSYGQRVNYIEDMSAEEVIDAIVGICNHLNIWTVAINDDYFFFTKKKEKIVRGLVDNGIDLICQTGIHLLKDEKFASKLMELFKIFSLGLEYTTDFGLQQLNKGFTWNDIQIAYANIKKYYNNNIITNNVIVDTPVYDKEEAVTHYNRLVDIKRDMESHNIIWFYTLCVLNILYQENFDSFYKEGHIRVPIENKPSGRFMLLKELRKVMEIPSFIDIDGVPFERIDKDGKVLESDIFLIDHDILKEIVNQDNFWKFRNKE
jgi:hypothetical protein